MTGPAHIGYGIPPIRCGSVCSGIEAFSVGTRGLPFEMAWLSEIEKFPCRVLAHHYPEVPNLGDMTKIFNNETFIDEPIELLVGGTPCQSFSIAGLRGGLDDDRGNLALVFARILLQKQPRWFIWENVPGVFSSYSGRADSGTDGYQEGESLHVVESSDFATILSGFRECGYAVSYRVLDSQYFGVPQRRRRVFVVGHLGDDWRPSAAVLFERDSLRRDIAPRREARKEAAGASGAGAKIPSRDHDLKDSYDEQDKQPLACETADSLTIGANQTTGFCGDVGATLGSIDNGQRQWPATIAKSLSTKNERQDYETETFVPFTQSIDCRNDAVNDEISGTIQTKSNGGYSLNYVNPVLCIQTAQTGANGSNISEDVSHTLDKASVPAGCLQGSMIGREDKNGPAGDGMNVEQSFTLNKTDKHAVVYDTTQITSPENGSHPKEEICHALNKNQHPPLLVKGFQQNADGEVREGDVSGTLNKNSNASGRNTAMVHTTHIARRLTPKECLRLQGFPDDYLDIPGASDSAKNAVIGNSMTTQVMRWIAHRIALFEKVQTRMRGSQDGMIKTEEV